MCRQSNDGYVVSFLNLFDEFDVDLMLSALVGRVGVLVNKAALYTHEVVKRRYLLLVRRF